jgi:hypothetical protein
MNHPGSHVFRHRDPLPLLSWAFACCSLAGAACGQQTITLLETTQAEGVIKSVAAGVVEITDAQGQDAKFKIQDKARPGVSLAGAGAVINFPAKVEITGTLTPDALVPGTLVRFTAKLNRLGRTEGSLDKLLVFDEHKYAPGVTVDTPAEGQGFATCTVSGEVVSLRNSRLQVNVPKSDFVRSQRLVFPIAEGTSISTESDDYRRAKPGDKVRLKAARFDTGDVVIREISITLAPRTKDKERGKPSATEASKYRQLSDAPSPPRDLQSAHFLLHTDISDRNAKLLLDRLETMLTLVSQYFGRNPVGLIECYVVRDLSQWQDQAIPREAVAKIQEPAGVTLSLSVGNVTRSVVYSCDAHGVVQHESVHAYCSQTFGSTGPTWYSEGLAEMGHYWKKDQAAVDLEPVAIDYLKRGPSKQMLEIVAARQITGDSWQNYAWRWALCYLLASNPNYSGQFRALGIAMMSKQPGASFESVYGPVAKEISFEYDQFCQHLDNGYRNDLCAWQWNRKFQYLRGDGPQSVKVPAKYGWQASGIKLKAGQSYDAVAKGTWNVSADAEASDANGRPDGTGKLVGCLFRDYQLSAPFELGAKTTFVASQDGDLVLRCQDDWNKIGNHDGSITAYFRRTPAP